MAVRDLGNLVKRPGGGLYEPDCIVLELIRVERLDLLAVFHTCIPL